jgi:hypothetical protein
MKRLVLALYCIATVHEAFGQVESVVVGKGYAHIQTGPGTVILDPASNNYSFNANVNGNGIAAITPPRITGPINTVLLGTGHNNGVLVYHTGDRGWRWGVNGGDFGTSSLASLNAAFGNGTYTITVNGAPISLNLSGDAYPNATILSLTGGAWRDGQYVVDPALPMTITTNAFTAYGTHADDLICIAVFTPGFVLPFENVAPFGCAWTQARQFASAVPGANFLTYTVAANTFVPGHEYSAIAGFEAIVDKRPHASLPGSQNVATFHASTLLRIKAEAAPAPPPVFPMTVTANIGPVVSNATAMIQPRPQDVGTTASVYVFALAPVNLVQNAQSPGIAETKSVGGEAKDGEAAVQCVLAQLSGSGQLVGVSASSMQAYITGVLSAQAQAVTILNGVPTVNIGGAIFYIGYGSSPLDMVTRGINQRAVAVPSSNVCDPKPPQTGWWWNPLEDGRGFSIEVRGRNLFFASFLYDASGRSSWYVATGAVSLDGSLFNNELLSARGGQALGGGYPGFPTLRNEGPITLAFNNASTGTLVWPGGAVPIQRFNIVPDGLNKPPVPNQPESGWWWNESEAGRGFFLEWQGGILNIAGYMYDDQGNPVWYLTQNAQPTTNAQSFSSNWWSFGNGMTLMGPWRPHARVNGNVAPVTIQFQGAENAIMTLPNGRTTAITRHRF